MSAIQRYPTLTVVLETLLSTLDVLEPLDTLVSAVDVLEPAQALVQSRFNAIKPLLDLLRPVLVVLKPIQNELGHVLAGVKLIYTTLKPVLDPLGEYIAWLFPYALTFVQWEARLLLNAFTTFSVLLSHVTGPWLLPCLRVIMRDPGLKWTAVEHCRGLRLSVLLSATHLGLAYPTEIFDGHSVPEGEDTLLCIIANSLAVVAINLYTGCGFSLTPKFLDEDGVSVLASCEIDHQLTGTALECRKRLRHHHGALHLDALHLCRIVIPAEGRQAAAPTTARVLLEGEHRPLATRLCLPCLPHVGALGVRAG